MSSDQHERLIDVYVIEPDPKWEQYRYEVFIETPDGEAHAICAYLNDCIKFVKRWFEHRGLEAPEHMKVYGKKDKTIEMKTEEN